MSDFPIRYRLRTLPILFLRGPMMANYINAWIAAREAAKAVKRHARQFPASDARNSTS